MTARAVYAVLDEARLAWLDSVEDLVDVAARVLALLLLGALLLGRVRGGRR